MMNMNDNLNTLINSVSAWDGVTTAPHRFGGTEFNLGKVEIGHIHRNGMVDIPYTRTIREQLVAEGKTNLHHLLQDSGWSSFYIRRETDVEQAIWLMRVSYLQKRVARARRDEHALAEIRRGLDDLGVSDTVRTAVLGRHAAG